MEQETEAKQQLEGITALQGPTVTVSGNQRVKMRLLRQHGTFELGRCRIGACMRHMV